MPDKRNIVLATASICLIISTAWIDPVYEGNQRGITHYDKGEYSEAIEAFNSVRPRPRQSGIVYFNLGNAYYRSGEYSKAIEEYFRATRNADASLLAKTYYNLGNCQYRLGDLQQALHYYKKAIRLDPADVNSRTNYEFVLSKLDETSGDPGNGDGNPGDFPRSEQRNAISQPVPIDEKSREIIYKMLDAEELSRRGKPFRIETGTDKSGGKNW